MYVYDHLNRLISLDVITSDGDDLVLFIFTHQVGYSLKNAYMTFGL